MDSWATRCSVCGEKNYTGGLCHRHYRMAVKLGRPVELLRPIARVTRGMSLAEKLAFYCAPADPVTHCVNWTGALYATGYGKLTVEGRTHTAHRLIFERANGPIPAGLQILHSCDNRRCVALAHLSLGTSADNALDRNLKDRQASRLTRPQVVEILADKRPASAVAADYGVKAQAIYAIRHGKRWAHVPRPSPPT